MTLAELSILAGWDGITPAWITTAIAARHPGSVVDGALVALRDDGRATI